MRWTEPLRGQVWHVATELRIVPLVALRRQRGHLSSGELRSLEEAVRVAHGLTEVDP